MLSPFHNEMSDADESDEEFIDIMLHAVFRRRPKMYRRRPDYFVELRNDEFLDRFRLSQEAVTFLTSRIRNEISALTTRNHAVTPEQKVLLTLRFYATGSVQRTCSDFVGIHNSTASHIIKLVSRCVASLRPEFISMPEDDEARKQISQEVFSIAKFPRCIGAIDCTHIKLHSPGGNNAEIFRNRKGWFSINVQTISDAKMRIQNIVARWPRSAHDSAILRNSSVRMKFGNKEFGDYALVGDSGYAVSDYLLTPLHEPKNQAEDLYNESQIFTRNPVERSYGIWKRRFPVLSVGMNINMTTAMTVIIATAVLYNIACNFGNIVPPDSAEIENVVDMSIFPCVPLNNRGAERAANRQNERKCNRLIRYFASMIEN